MARVIRRRYLGGAAAALGGVLAAACGEVEIRYVQGPAGPAGPAGAQGERGATGAAGAQGQAGAAGQTIVVEKEKPVVVEKEVVKEVVVERPVVVEKVVEKVVAPTTGPKNITFDTDWGPSGPRAEVIKRAMELYNEMHPEVNVDVRIDAGREQAKSGSVFARTAVLIAADDMGDLFLWAGYVFVYWAKRGLFADLTPFMKQWGRTIDDYIGVPQHEIWPYPNGKVWGLPFQGGTGDWLYNKSVLDRHGIEPNENWTHDDLIETAKQVQDPENGLWGFTTPGWGTALLTMYNIGGEKGADNGEKYLFDTPVGHQAIQFWEDIIHKHRVAPRPQDTRTEDGKSKGWSPWKGNYVFWTGYPSAGGPADHERIELRVADHVGAEVAGERTAGSEFVRPGAHGDEVCRVPRRAGGDGRAGAPPVGSGGRADRRGARQHLADLASGVRLGRERWIRRGGTGTSSWTGSTTGLGTRHRSSGTRCTGRGIRSSPRCGVARSRVWRQRRRPTGWPT